MGNVTASRSLLSSVEDYLLYRNRLTAHLFAMYDTCLYWKKRLFSESWRGERRGHIMSLTRDPRAPGHSLMPPPQAGGRGGQPWVLEGSLKPTHQPAFASGPVLCSRWWTLTQPLQGALQASPVWVCGQCSYGALVLLAQWKYSAFFFFKSAMHIVQPRSIHNKLLAWGILHERFYICSVHRPSQFLCFEPIREITWTTNDTNNVLGNMYLCWKKQKQKNPTEYFPSTNTWKVQKPVSLCDVFAHFYKQDKLKQKHIQNLTWLNI